MFADFFVILHLERARAWENAENRFEQIPESGETLKTILNKSPSLGKR